MSPEAVIHIMQQALRTALFLAAPPLVLALCVGLAVALFQAVTSIQEQTMVFIPKIIAAAVALMIFMPWMIATIIDFTAVLFQSIPEVIGK